MNTIYSVSQRKEGETGGMGENWDVIVIDFDTDSVRDEWYPISKDSTYRYSFESLMEGAEPLNWTSYDFSKGELMSYGGEGYGSFDWHEITRLSDEVSIRATSCTGHCGNQPIEYSKQVFNKSGQLSYTVHYPTPIEPEGPIEREEHKMSLQEYEKFLNSNVNAEQQPDTLYYRYDKKGLALKIYREKSITNAKEYKKLITNLNDIESSQFHQCYIGKIKMEKFIQAKLGFTPEMLLLEIYERGVFCFTLNPLDKKYYRTGDLQLE